MSVSGMHKLTYCITHDSGDLDDDSISNESETASDGSLDDDILAEKIITDDFNFKISDPA